MRGWIFYTKSPWGRQQFGVCVGVPFAEKTQAANF